MKSINFISPVPPKKQQAFALWVYFSFCILALLLAALALLYLRHRNLHTQIASDLEELKKASSLFETYVEQKKALLQEKVMLEERINKLRACTNNAKIPQEFLTNLASITPPSVCLETVQGTLGGTMLIEGVTRDAQAVTSFLNLLNNCPQLSDLTLLSLTPSEEKSPDGRPVMHFSLSGLWNNYGSY